MPLPLAPSNALGGFVYVGTKTFFFFFFFSKPQQGTITHQSGWLLSKSLQAINAGEGVEKREPSYTVDGNAN